jgi:hypothetical protein
MLCDSGYPTYVLGTWVREKKVLSLEEAVRRMTSDVADFFGIKDRGRIAPGMAADLVIFDPKTVGSVGRPERRYDLPGGAKRMVMRSQGIHMTLVNGEVTWARGPGRYCARNCRRRPALAGAHGTPMASCANLRAWRRNFRSGRRRITCASRSPAPGNQGATWTTWFPAGRAWRRSAVRAIATASSPSIA